MVENQQSINAILSFAAKSVAPELLESLLIGRDKTAEQVFAAITAIAEDGNNQQILIIGQRGMGKTHLLRILFHRSQPLIKDQKLVIAYFSEEEYGVSDYFDFLIRILYAFIRWDDEKAAHLSQRMDVLKETAGQYQAELAEEIIQEYVGTRPLLILAENFGDILNAIGESEQHKLRAWMYKNRRVSIIATSQSISDDFDREDRPFYGFFSIRYLKSLSYRESYSFLISLAKLDQREDVIEHLKNKGKGQVRAIHQLVKGNHRLLVTFYEFLKSDTLAKLSTHFIKTINDLKPYYETYIRYLPAQQQKIVRYIALSRRAQQGTEIQKNCFIDQKSLSKQLSELVKKKLLESIIDPVDKRNRLYDINEPLLRISIEVGEHKEGITALFVDFLALYYDETELKEKIEKFTDLLQQCADHRAQQDFLYEILAIKKAIEQQVGKKNKEQAELVLAIQEAVNVQDFKKAAELIDAGEGILKYPIADILKSLIFVAEKSFDKAVNILRGLPNDIIMTQPGLPGLMGMALSSLGRERKDIEILQESLRLFEIATTQQTEDPVIHAEWATTLFDLAKLKSDDHYILEGSKIIQKAIALDPENIKLQIDLALQRFMYGLGREDKKQIKSVLKDFKTIWKKGPEFPQTIGIWGGVLSFTMLIYQDCMPEEKIFYNSFKRLKNEERLELWKRYAGLNVLPFFKLMESILLEDIKHFGTLLVPVVVDWLVNILAAKWSVLTLSELDQIKEIPYKYKEEYPELAIISSYADLYRDYVINEDKNSLYRVSKEQREFFEKHILGDNMFSSGEETIQKILKT